MGITAIRAALSLDTVHITTVAATPCRDTAVMLRYITVMDPVSGEIATVASVRAVLPEMTSWKPRAGASKVRI
jgi:hypothetical protein